VLREITSVEFELGSLTPDPGVTRLAFVHATETGRGLSILDLPTQRRTVLPLTNEVTQVNGWSPDGRWLAFVQSAPPRAGDGAGPRPSWVALWDAQTGALRRLTGHEWLAENYFFWLTTNTYFYASREPGQPAAGLYLGDLEHGPGAKIGNFLPELVVLATNRAASGYRGEIVAFALQPLPPADALLQDTARVIEPLSDFSTNGFDAIKWLRYRPETGQFLFCARATNSTWRHLYRYDPATRQLDRLSDEDTYNGQWLQQGRSWAYVVNTNGAFQLAVRPAERAGWTNLFTGGGVVNYTVAPDGERLFATASLGGEPHGLWEYDVRTRALRPVLTGAGTPFAVARYVPPDGFTVKAADGLEVPCFVLRPPGAAEAPAGKRFPAVVYVPPASSQFQRAFDERSQLLANLGCYFLAVNYRGCDGYGRDYASRGDPAQAADDVWRARERLLENPQVDPQNVFHCTISAGAEVTFNLLANHPGAWRGVVLDKPSFCRTEGWGEPGKLPPFLVIAGGADPGYASVRAFERWAAEQDVRVRTVVHTNAAHFTFKVAERRDKLDQTARFVLEHRR
jgi:dipeptidyl aminopeptidase/acylaminoacyl peptidase